MELCYEGDGQQLPTELRARRERSSANGHGLHVKYSAVSYALVES